MSVHQLPTTVAVACVHLHSKVPHSAETCGEAEVVRNDHGGVERLEVQHYNWVCVEL